MPVVACLRRATQLTSGKPNNSMAHCSGSGTANTGTGPTLLAVCESKVREPVRKKLVPAASFALIDDGETKANFAPAVSAAAGMAAVYSPKPGFGSKALS